MFSGHWSSVSGDITYLLYHVSSQDHVIEGTDHFTGGSSEQYVTNLPSILATGIVVVKI